jgi:hypothetical protein
MKTLDFIQTIITRAHSKRDKSITEEQKIDYRGRQKLLFRSKTAKKAKKDHS